MQPEDSKYQSENFRWGVIALISFGALASIVCTYLLYLHFQPGASSFCNISSTLNCDTVNKSEYSVLFGIPVALLGLGYYIAIIGLGTLLSSEKNRQRFDIHDLLNGFTLITVIGTLFTLYLTYQEAYTIKAYCILCLAQQFLILCILYTLIRLRKLTASARDR